MTDGVEVFAAQVLAAAQPVGDLGVPGIVVSRVQPAAAADVQHHGHLLTLQQVPDWIVVQVGRGAAIDRIGAHPEGFDAVADAVAHRLEGQLRVF